MLPCSRIARTSRSGTTSDLETEVKGSLRSLGQYGTFTALRLPSFAWFLTGTTLTNAAQWIQQVTLSWLVYDLTSSGAMLGTLNLVRSVATVGLAPVEYTVREKALQMFVPAFQ